MIPLYSFTTPPGPCSYLHDQSSEMEYEVALEISAEEYLKRLEEGWRHFGYALFRPQCRHCNACQSLRVPVRTFRPNRSQKRTIEKNKDSVQLQIVNPSTTQAKLRLHDKFHRFQADDKGWPRHAPKDFDGYKTSFVDNPFPVYEWCYLIDDRLVGVGYVDHLPNALSAIYFFHDPDERERSLGTWNVLSILDYARRENLDYVYLGYYVEGCRSLEYKANFKPNEVFSGGTWRPFLDA